jgi:hypothetical protein
MGVKISDKARAYLDRRRVKSLVLSLTALKIGCCHTVAFKDVEVSCGSPEAEGHFWRRHVHDIDVFVDRRIDPADEIEIKCQGWGRFCFLYAEGSSLLA